MIKTNLNEYNYLSNYKLVEKYSESLLKISNLNGTLKHCQFKKMFEKIVWILENKNNNEIENIHTTYNTILDVYANTINNKNYIDKSNEVQGNYSAIKYGIEFIQKNNYLNKNLFTKIQQIIRGDDDEIRNGYGIKIVDGKNNVVYTPPQDKGTILKYLDELENFINNTHDNFSLIKMAIIHYQFEAIHPYNDGNGRTGRIINILYLVKSRIIDFPFLPLSLEILKTKTKYYELLKKVGENENNLDQFIIYILECIDNASGLSNQIIEEIYKIFKKINLNNKIDNLFVKNFLYKNLIISKKTIAEQMNISIYKANKYLEIMISENLLILISNNAKSYIMKDIIKIIEKL